MATHSSILAWEIPRTGEPGWAIVHGVAKSWTQLRTKTHKVLSGIWNTKTRASSMSGLWQPSVDSLTKYKAEKQQKNGMLLIHAQQEEHFGVYSALKASFIL